MVVVMEMILVVVAVVDLVLMVVIVLLLMLALMLLRVGLREISEESVRSEVQRRRLQVDTVDRVNSVDTDSRHRLVVWSAAGSRAEPKAKAHAAVAVRVGIVNKGEIVERVAMRGLVLTLDLYLRDLGRV
jgi:hypothetical protein